MGKHCFNPDVPPNPPCLRSNVELSTHTDKENISSDVSVCEKAGTAMAVAAVPLPPAMELKVCGKDTQIYQCSLHSFTHMLIKYYLFCALLCSSKDGNHRIPGAENKVIHDYSCFRHSFILQPFSI